MTRRPVATIWILLAFTTGGCHHVLSPSAGRYETITAMPHRDARTANIRHRQAVEYLKNGNLERAAQRLNEALLADVSYGPAHNSLGTVYFHQQDYYLAAWEFSYAQRLMPERPEPYNNLGLVYETLGRFDEAGTYYQLAVELAPDSPEYLGNLVRSRVRADDKSESVRYMLEQLLLIENRPQWRRWVEKQLSLTDFQEDDWEIIVESIIPDEGLQLLPPGQMFESPETLPAPAEPSIRPAPEPRR